MQFSDIPPLTLPPRALQPQGMPSLLDLPPLDLQTPMPTPVGPWPTNSNEGFSALEFSAELTEQLRQREIEQAFASVSLGNPSK